MPQLFLTAFMTLAAFWLAWFFWGYLVGFVSSLFG